METCNHPGSHVSGVQCPDCGLFSSHGWEWDTSSENGWGQAWGGVCKTHGEWSDST